MNQDDSVKRLLTILEAEERLYLEMRDLLQRERELILSLDSAGLETAVRDKSALADEGRLLEESRAEVVRELANVLGIETGATSASDSRRGTPTLSDLTKAIGSDDGGLRQAHSRLSALVGAVKELLDANACFAGRAQGQVQSTLRLLGRLMPGEPTYGPSIKGPRPEAISGGRLVERTA